MTNLGSIAINPEGITGNVRPLLHEIRHALHRLAGGGSGTVIDLRSLPLAPGEEQQIESELGQGEIYAELNANGITSIRETSFPGVWLVTHTDDAEEITARFIEVTACPDLLRSQQNDIEFGLERLDQHLSEDRPDGATNVSGNEQ